MKLEPTEAQRKAMGEAADEWQGRVDTTDEYIDRIIAAANSIADGAPVGTIARRPDGLNVAYRLESSWHYALPAMGNAGSDADSWPVIFHPGNPGAPIGAIAKRPDGAAVAVRVQYDHDGFWGAPVWSYMPLNDPELFADEPTDDDEADSWPVIYDPTKPEPRREYALCVPHPSGPVPNYDTICEHPSRLEGRPKDQPDEAVYSRLVYGWELVDPTAQQEPAYTVAAASEEMAKHWDNSIVTTTKREPRVVDRLGVDEQGSRWRDENGLIHSFTEGADGGRWKTQIGGSWYPWAKGVVPHGGEYTEILEPRVLPSLDCEEARDGTEWETVEELPSGGRCSYQYRPWAREWWGRSPNERRDGHPGYPFVDAVKVVGPFREVLGDPS